MELVIRTDEQYFLHKLDPKMIKHLILTCYCEISIEHILPLSEFQRVTYGFIKNQHYIIKNSIYRKLLPKSLTINNYTISCKESLTDFLHLIYASNPIYDDPQNPLYLQISNIKTLILLRQVFVRRIKCVSIVVMNKQHNEQIIDEKLYNDIVQAYKDHGKKLQGQHLNGLRIKIVGMISTTLAKLFLEIFNGAEQIRLQNQIWFSIGLE